MRRQREGGPNCGFFSLTEPVFFFLLVLAGVPLAGPARAEGPAPNSPNPLRQELGALLDRQAADWSRGDIEAFASIYADDATFVAPSGMTQGRAALVERYRKRYPDRAAMGALTLEVLELRAAGSDAATASLVARWTLRFAEKPPASGLTLLVFERQKGGWRIVQDASM
ncbi:MAG: nuclear transport factor 2 family protein [Thermoanaerobaculia bacterium]